MLAGSCLADGRCGHRSGCGWFQIFIQAFLAAFAPEAALTVTAKTGGGIKLVGAINPHHAGFDLARCIQRHIDVFAPHAGGKAVAGVVGERNGFGRCAESHADEHWPENFHLCHGGCGRNIGEQCGRIKVTVLGAGPRGLPQCGAFAASLLHQLLNFLKLPGCDDGANVDGFVERVAHAQLIHARAQAVEQLVRHAFLHQQARAGTAHLPLVEPDGIDDAFNHAVQVSCVKDHKG